MSDDDLLTDEERIYFLGAACRYIMRILGDQKTAHPKSGSSKRETEAFFHAKGALETTEMLDEFLEMWETEEI